MDNKKSKECKVVYTDNIRTNYRVDVAEINIAKIREKEYNRAKKKANTKEMIDEYLDR